MASAAFTKEEYELRKQLVEDIKLLSEEGYKEIFRILKRFNVPYSENSNGVHFDLCLVPSDGINQIQQYLNLSSAQKEEEEARTKELEGLRAETHGA